MAKSKVRQNSIFGRVMRTIAYVALLIVSLFFTLLFLSTGVFGEFEIVGKILEIYEKVKFLENPMIVAVSFYGGLLILVWCVGRSYLFRILTSVLLISTFFIASQGPILGDAVVFPDVISNILVKLSDIYELLPSIIVVVFFLFIFVTFLKKKPARFSTWFVGLGLLAVFLMHVVNIGIYYAADFVADYLLTIIEVQLYLIFGGYAAMALGSMFGTIGCFMK